MCYQIRDNPYLSTFSSLSVLRGARYCDDICDRCLFWLVAFFSMITFG